MPPISPPPAPFPSTRWSLLKRLSEPGQRHGAIEALCRDYWPPVYAFLRRRYPPQDAEDLTQEFLLMMLRQEIFDRAEPGAGRLRSWVLKSLELFLSNYRRTASAARRGGGAEMLSLQSGEMKKEIARLAATSATPAEAFDRAWISALVRTALQDLRHQYAAAGRSAVFESLLPWLLNEGEPSAQPLAAQACGLTLANFRVHLHRLRGRYREALRHRIAETVSGEEELAAELAHLFSVSGQSL